MTGSHISRGKGVYFSWERGLACITVFLWFIIVRSNLLGYPILVALRDETAKCCPMVALSQCIWPFLWYSRPF